MIRERDLRPWVVLIVVLALAGGVAGWAESASVLLEKAIYSEETVGDLDAAIQLYQKTIQEAEANRPCAAEAYYRLGMCHMKKGQTEPAQNAFKTLIDPQERAVKVVLFS